MAWRPISGTVPQYSTSANALASGYYLKAYKNGTTTAINLATDKTGGTTLAKVQLNASGYPIDGSDNVFIPHVNEEYKLALYQNATDADADTVANADWIPDNIENEHLINVGSDATTAYTVDLGDQNNAVHMTSGSANTITIPPNSSVAFPIGTFIIITQVGAGLTTIAAGAGVTINKRTTLKSAGQYATFGVRKTATDTWYAAGDLAVS